MADKGIGVGECAHHGEYYLDAKDSPCPSCEEGESDRHEECPCCMDETMGSSFVEEGVTYWEFYCDRCDHVWIPEEEE